MPKHRCVQCIEQFQKEQQADDELTASIVLIDALLAQGKQSEAEKEMEAANRSETRARTAFLRLQFELVSGRVLLEVRNNRRRQVRC